MLKFLLRLGIFGIFGLSVIDSTFFVFLPPLIIDTALVILISHHREWMPFYALFATAGSLAGCTLDYLIIGKSSEKTLAKLLPKEKFEYVKGKMRENAFWSLVIASLLPPPFPFSPFIWVAASIKVSLKKTLSAISIGRGVRFIIEGVLAIYFGRQLLNVLDSTIVKWFVISVFIISIIGTIFSIFKWLKAKQR